MKDRPKDIAPYELKSVAVVGVGQMGAVSLIVQRKPVTMFFYWKLIRPFEGGLESISKRIMGGVERNPNVR